MVKQKTRYKIAYIRFQIKVISQEFNNIFPRIAQISVKTFLWEIS